MTIQATRREFFGGAMASVFIATPFGAAAKDETVLPTPSHTGISARMAAFKEVYINPQSSQIDIIRAARDNGIDLAMDESGGVIAASENPDWAAPDATPV